jgi:hypothetical protein
MFKYKIIDANIYFRCVCVFLKQIIDERNRISCGLLRMGRFTNNTYLHENFQQSNLKRLCLHGLVIVRSSKEYEISYLCSKVDVPISDKSKRPSSGVSSRYLCSVPQCLPTLNAEELCASCRLGGAVKRD